MINLQVREYWTHSCLYSNSFIQLLHDFLKKCVMSYVGF